MMNKLKIPILFFLLVGNLLLIVNSFKKRFDVNELRITNDLLVNLKNVNLSTQIPRIVHQTWKNNHIPSKWKSTVKSWKFRHPDWEFKLWTDEDSYNFIKDKYNWFLPIYQSYPYDIQRVDAIRYFILYEYGGFYVDMDIGCRRKLHDSLLSFAAFIPKTKPIGYSNDFLATRPRHPFYLQLITNLSKSISKLYPGPYATVFFSTGPLYLTNQFISYNQEHSYEFDLANKDNVLVLDPQLYSEANRFLIHVRGNSWHSWDAKYILFIYSNYKKILIFLTLLIITYFIYKTFKFKSRKMKYMFNKSNLF